MMLAKPDVDRFKYGYDYASNRTYRDIDSAIYGTNDKDQAYLYDGLHRLTNYKQGTLTGSSITSMPPTAEQTWTLDELGNWKTFLWKVGGSTHLDQARTVNKANEIQDFTTATGNDWRDPTYDAAGNMTNGPYDGSGNQRPIKYDAWNRVVEVKLGPSLVVEQYEYDGLNRRIVKTKAPGLSSTILHSYYNEDWQELEVKQEVSSSEDPDPLEQFIWHPYYIDALVTRFYDSDVTDMTGPVQHYFTHDANFNVTAAVNTSSAVVERFDYTPYGQVTFLNSSFGSPSSSSSIAQRYLYTGRPLDGAGGLYHYRHRQYDPNLGNFITRDPIGYRGSEWNLYEYIGSSPVNGLDPFGLCGPNNPNNPDPCLCDQSLYACYAAATVAYLACAFLAWTVVGAGVCTVAYIVMNGICLWQYDICIKNCKK